VQHSAVQFVKKSQPIYPSFSRRLGEQGQAMLRVLIDELGLPVRIEVESSSGHARLDDSAIAAARSSRFSPYREDGVIRPVWVRLPYVFDLEP
jgi:protein TonB